MGNRASISFIRIAARAIDQSRRVGWWRLKSPPRLAGAPNIALALSRGIFSRLSVTIAILTSMLFAKFAIANEAVNVWMNSSSAFAGGGNSFDVDLNDVVTNGSTPSIILHGYTINLSVPSNSGITFNSATSLTVPAVDPYIFSTLAGWTFTPTIDNNDLGTGLSSVKVVATASVAPGNVTLTTTSMGLANISFSVGAGVSPGVVQVTLTPTMSTLNGDSIPPASVTGGTVTVVPEPEMLPIGILTCIGMLARRGRPRYGNNPFNRLASATRLMAIV